MIEILNYNTETDEYSVNEDSLLEHLLTEFTELDRLDKDVDLKDSVYSYIMNNEVKESYTSLFGYILLDINKNTLRITGYVNGDFTKKDTQYFELQKRVLLTTIDLDKLEYYKYDYNTDMIMLDSNAVNLIESVERNNLINYNIGILNQVKNEYMESSIPFKGRYLQKVGDNHRFRIQSIIQQLQNEPVKYEEIPNTEGGDPIRRPIEKVFRGWRILNKETQIEEFIDVTLNEFLYLSNEIQNFINKVLRVETLINLYIKISTKNNLKKINVRTEFENKFKNYDEVTITEEINLLNRELVNKSTI